MSNELGPGFQTSVLKLINSGECEHYMGGVHDFEYDPAVEVLSFRDQTYNDGYCETCWYEYAVVEIDVRTRSGVETTFVYEDDFADLLDTLTKL